MKVLHVITGFQLGGAERSASNLAIGLAKRGHECRVATVLQHESSESVGAALRKDIDDGGIVTVDLGAVDTRFGLLFASFRLRRLIVHWKPTIVHSHTDIPDFVVSIARRTCRFRIARSVRNTELWPTRPIAGRIAETGFWDDLVVAVSNDAKDAYRDLRRRFGLPESGHQVVIRNALPLPDVAEPVDQKVVASRFGMASDKIRLCFIGRITPQKGLDVLIDALGCLPAAVRDTLEVHVLGDGDPAEQLKARSHDARLPVKFHGAVAGAATLISAFDAVLIPSRFEGFPLVALEAMAAGVPVIATDAPGLRETLPVDWPFVAETGSAPSLAQQIEAFLERSEDRASLSRCVKDWAFSNFSFNEMVDRYVRAYRSYLEAK